MEAVIGQKPESLAPIICIQAEAISVAPREGFSLLHWHTHQLSVSLTNAEVSQVKGWHDG